jgi:hypothetical protein
MLNHIAARQRFAAVPRYIPIDVVNKLRYDPMWQEAIVKLERGQLGLGIRYAEEAAKTEAKQIVQAAKTDTKKVEQLVKVEVREAEKAVKEEVSDLKADIDEIRAKVSENAINSEVEKLGSQINVLKEVVKIKKKLVRKAGNSNNTSIQVSRDFKKKLKSMKGKRTYEELIKEQMKI